MKLGKRCCHPIPFNRVSGRDRTRTGNLVTGPSRITVSHFPSTIELPAQTAGLAPARQLKYICLVSELSLLAIHKLNHRTGFSLVAAYVIRTFTVSWLLTVAVYGQRGNRTPDLGVRHLNGPFPIRMNIIYSSPCSPAELSARSYPNRDLISSGDIPDDNNSAINCSFSFCCLYSGDI